MPTLAATVTAAAVAKHHGVKAFINMSQMTLAQMRMTETTASPQHKRHWLAEQALNWSGLPVVHGRPTVLLEGFFLMFTVDSVRESHQIRRPFGEGQDVAGRRGRRGPCARRAARQSAAAPRQDRSPDRSAVREQAFLCTGVFEGARPHDHLSGHSGRAVAGGLLERGLPGHLVNHLATMADLHRAGRYDRMSDDVLMLTGQGPLRVQEIVRKHAAPVTASAREA